MLVEDVIVDVVGVFHGLPHLREWLRRSITRCALPNFSIIHESGWGRRCSIFSACGLPGLPNLSARPRHSFMAVVHAAEAFAQCRSEGIWLVRSWNNRPLRRLFLASLKSAASTALFCSRSNINRPTLHSGAKSGGCVNMTAWIEPY
jgi:hypothetical protein